MKIEKIFPWSDEADSGLSGALGADRAQIVAGVNSRGLECYRLWDGAAYMVTRVEDRELTVCCYQGTRSAEAFEWVRSQCKSRGIRSIRIHSAQSAVGRLLRKFDFRLAEYVYRCEVA